jgi:hypothetical protein
VKNNWNEKNIYSAMRNLNAGDTLVFASGIYNLELLAVMNSGENWDKPIVLMAEEAGKVIFMPKKGNRVLNLSKWKRGKIVHHVEFNGFIFDGANVVSGVVKITDGNHHIRIVNCEIRNSKNQGILLADNRSNFNEIINCKIYNNGINDLQHGIYITSDYNLVKGCEIFQNAGAGINIYDGKESANWNTIENCNIHHNGRAGKRGVGIGIHTGIGNKAINNLIHNNVIGIHTDYGSSNTLIERNIIYDHPGYDIIIGLNAGDYKLIDNTLLKESSIPEIQIRKEYLHALEGQTILTNRLDLMKKIEEDWPKKEKNNHFK